MKKTIKQKEIKYIKSLSDEDLKYNYSSIYWDCLGTRVDAMIERGYSIEDIREQEQYEKYQQELCDLYEDEMNLRGLKF